MAPRWPIVVGITAILGGIAWFALREPTPTPRTPDGSGVTIAAPGTGKAAIGAPLPPVLDGGVNAVDREVTGGEPPRPTLPEASANTGPGSAQTFEAQQRDVVWAPKTEAEIRRRFTTIGGARLDSTECRRDQCLLVVVGTQSELSRTIAEVEEPQGLQGFANHILLTAPEQQNGNYVMRFYATFDR